MAKKNKLIRQKQYNHNICKNKTSQNMFFILLLFLVAILMVVPLILADNSNSSQSNMSSIPSILEEKINTLYEYSVTLAAIGFIFVFIYSGIKIIFSQSELERKDAWETLGYIVIGAVLVLLAPRLAELVTGNVYFFGCSN